MSLVRCKNCGKQVDGLTFLHKTGQCIKVNTHTKKTIQKLEQQNKIMREALIKIDIRSEIHPDNLSAQALSDHFIAIRKISVSALARAEELEGK